MTPGFTENIPEPKRSYQGAPKDVSLFLLLLLGSPFSPLRAWWAVLTQGPEAWKLGALHLSISPAGHTLASPAPLAASFWKQKPFCVEEAVLLCPGPAPVAVSCVC